jgi:hypothetical protein
MRLRIAKVAFRALHQPRTWRDAVDWVAGVAPQRLALSSRAGQTAVEAVDGRGQARSNRDNGSAVFKESANRSVMHMSRPTD